MESYFHFLPEELLGFIVPLDSDASGLFNLIEAYPELKNHVITSFLIEETLYPTFKKVSDDLKKYSKVEKDRSLIKSMNEIFIQLINFIVNEYDVSDDINFIDKYYRAIYEISDLVGSHHDLKNLSELLLDNPSVYWSIYHLIFYRKYPSIIEYYYKNIYQRSFDSEYFVRLDNLYYSINTILFEEYHLLNSDSIDEDEIIDISIAIDDLNELEISDKYNKLIKFLIDNNVNIV